MIKLVWERLQDSRGAERLAVGLLASLVFICCGLVLAAEGPAADKQPDKSTISTEVEVPRDATALCADKTWSSAERRQGACSGHGGIERWFGKPPKGATARCKDGTYSKSKKAQGACSSHGGVAFWLKTTKPAK